MDPGMIADHNTRPTHTTCTLSLNASANSESHESVVTSREFRTRRLLLLLPLLLSSGQGRECSFFLHLLVAQSKSSNWRRSEIGFDKLSAPLWFMTVLKTFSSASLFQHYSRLIHITQSHDFLRTQSRWHFQKIPRCVATNIKSDVTCSYVRWQSE